ncbi:hypothetical protein E4U61_003376 [Claviceps capensis]|nr:hypothetical protein E4U61_003376 [Claviceps capensis]
MDIIEAGECLRQWLGVIDQDEKDVRILEKEALCGAQKYEYSGDAGVFDEVIDDDEFHRPIFDDSKRGME